MTNFIYLLQNNIAIQHTQKMNKNTKKDRSNLRSKNRIKTKIFNNTRCK